MAIAGLGVATIYYNAFPYPLLPPRNFTTPGLAYASGIIFIFVGAWLVTGRKARPVALLFGGALLLIFCFYHIPYELLISHNYLSLGEWENAEKELALAGGALVIADGLPAGFENLFTLFLAKLAPVGSILFAITIICFSFLHFVYAKQAADYIPAWVPWHLFWMYFCGAALLGAGIAIILKIRTRLFATLLGAMILSWFIVLHIPKVIEAAPADQADEITSAFLALAYSGIALVIAGTNKRSA